MFYLLEDINKLNIQENRWKSWWNHWFFTAFGHSIDDQSKSFFFCQPIEELMCPSLTLELKVKLKCWVKLPTRRNRPSGVFIFYEHNSFNWLQTINCLENCPILFFLRNKFILFSVYSKIFNVCNMNLCIIL